MAATVRRKTGDSTCGHQASGPHPGGRFAACPAPFVHSRGYRSPFSEQLSCVSCTFGRPFACSDDSPRSRAPISRWNRARSCCSPARTAPARRRCSGCAPGSCRCGRVGRGARCRSRGRPPLDPPVVGARRPRDVLLRRSDRAREHPVRDARGRSFGRRCRRRARTARAPPVANVAHGRLSQGQRRRVALAIALARDPRLLLLDEPHAGLDEQGRAVLDEVVRAAPAEGRTVLIASHELEIARQTSRARFVSPPARCTRRATRPRAPPVAPEPGCAFRLEADV